MFRRYPALSPILVDAPTKPPRTWWVSQQQDVLEVAEPQQPALAAKAGTAAAAGCVPQQAAITQISHGAPQLVMKLKPDRIKIRFLFLLFL